MENLRMKNCLLFLLIFYYGSTLAQNSFIVTGNPSGLIYTDPQPDISFSAVAIDETSGYGSTSLDVDGDGMPDFGIVALYFTFGTSKWKGIYMNGFPPDNQIWNIYNNTACAVFDQSQYNLAHPLQEGDTIFANNNSSWIDLAYLGYDDETQGSPCVQGRWTDNAPHYAAIRMKKNNNWYYGWIHLSGENIVQQITIYDYAIQAEVTGISSIQNAVTVFPNPVRSHFSINNASAMNYSLYDENGIVLFHGSIDHSPQMMDVSALRAGIYFLKIYGEKQNIVKRLVKF
jgi:hypothetical protein